jgi:hypothetical protein
MGERHGVATDLTFRREVEQPYFLIARNEGLIAIRAEKAFDLKA